MQNSDLFRTTFFNISGLSVSLSVKTDKKVVK